MVNQLTDIVHFFSEFCGHQNDGIPFTSANVPSSNATEYEVEPPPKTEETEEEKPDNEAAAIGKGTSGSATQRSSLIIFAVDISGSMNITTEVPALQGNEPTKLRYN